MISTPIVDVQRHYGAVHGVAIADGADAFVAACEAALALPVDGAWRDKVDALFTMRIVGIASFVIMRGVLYPRLALSRTTA